MKKNKYIYGDRTIFTTRREKKIYTTERYKSDNKMFYYRSYIFLSYLASHQHIVKKRGKKRNYDKKRGEKEAYNFRPKKTKIHWHNTTINPRKLARYQYNIG
jgi:predicted HTH domain antitoxin